MINDLEKEIQKYCQQYYEKGFNDGLNYLKNHYTAEEALEISKTINSEKVFKLNCEFCSVTLPEVIALSRCKRSQVFVELAKKVGD